MGTTDREHQRLKDLYSHMADGELEEIAGDFLELTDIAREELKSELARRGLKIDLEESLPAPVPQESPDLVDVCLFDNLGEAVVARGFLASAGIECFLFDGSGNLITDSITSPIGLPSIGGIELRVKAEDAQAANEILQPAPGESEE